MAGVTANGAGSKSLDPLIAFSWLDWSRDNDEYVGGDYRIRLLGPNRWELLCRGEHLRLDDRLSSALVQAERHFVETLRWHDMVKWALVVVGSLAGLWLVEATLGFTLGILLIAPLSYVGLSAVARLFATIFSMNRDDPYRRRAPWERRDWWRFEPTA